MDAANARAAAQERIAHHLILQACSARRLISVVSFRVRALASNRMKARVSFDHRPATSPANTNNRVRARRPTSSGQVLSMRRRARTPSLSLAPAVADPSQCSADTRVVSTHCKLGATKQKQPIHHNFEAASISGVRCCNVHVPDHHVDSNSSSCLPANSGSSAFHCERPSSQLSRARARCSMVVTRFEWTATSAAH